VSNQRRGSWHAASANDEGGGNVPLGSLIKFVRAAQAALEKESEDDAALRFEIFGDFLEKDVANGAPFTFSTKALGL
jgi:hypothetical protein